MQDLEEDLDSAGARMALLLASGAHHVLGSVATSEKVQLAQMGLYLVQRSIETRLLCQRTRVYN